MYSHAESKLDSNVLNLARSWMYFYCRMKHALICTKAAWFTSWKVSFWKGDSHSPCLHRQCLLPTSFSLLSHKMLSSGSYRFPVEHVQTPGGQASWAAWNTFSVAIFFFSILLNIFCFLYVEISRELLFNSLMLTSLSSRDSAVPWNCVGIAMCDRFPVEHVQTPGGQPKVLNVSFSLNDRFPVEHVQTPGGQAAPFLVTIVRDNFIFSQIGPAWLKQTWRADNRNKTAEKYMIKIKARCCVLDGVKCGNCLMVECFHPFYRCCTDSWTTPRCVINRWARLCARYI